LYEYIFIARNEIFGGFMADVNGGSESFFSKETCQAFLKQKKIPLNERFRGDDETIFDAALSEDADFTKHPEGSEILEAIRSYT
jgi:hypothetical protein